MTAAERKLLKVARVGDEVSASYGDGRIHRGKVESHRRVGLSMVAYVQCDDGVRRSFNLGDFKRVPG